MLRKNLRRVDSSAEEAAVPTDSRRRSGRPRDASVDVRVLRETFDLLAEKGFRGLRIDEVARRAGVPKSTIYRRWSSLVELAVDAVDAALGPRMDEPGEDPLMDLSTLIARAHSYVATSPLARALPQIALELVGHPEAQAANRDRVIAPLRNSAIDAVDRARAAGQWPGPDPTTSVDMMIGTIAYRLNYLGHIASLEETFDVAEAVARRTLPRPSTS